MAANTSILIKRSSTHVRPSSLLAGELGYSYVSNTIFIGTPDGTGVINVGGVYYTSQIDDATDSATGNKLVRRDSTGSASFDTIYGSLGTASGVADGTYGSTTEIPVVTVAANGIITNITTSSISTALDIAGDSGTDSVTLGTDTLTFTGGDGITSSIDAGNNTVIFDVDNTVIRTSGGQIIDGALEISGNLIVRGTTTAVGSTTVQTDDSMILLAANNTVGDVVDTGFVGTYYDGSTQRYAGIMRNAGNKKFYVYQNYDQDPVANVVNVSDGSFQLGELNANIEAPYANVTTSFTTGNSSTATFNGTVDIENDLTLNGTTTIRNGYGIQFKTSDETAYAEIYNDGGSGHNYLFVQSDDNEFTGNVIVDKALSVTQNATLSAQVYVPNISQGATSNVVYFNASTGALSYGTHNASQIANGAYSLSISGTDGLLVTNGAGLQLNNGALLKDTSSNSVAFGKYAGTISQGGEAVAIGDSAGYNTQGDYAVAIGYGAGNANQTAYSVALGLNAGMDTQGGEAVAIGPNAAQYSQGGYSIAIGSGSGNNTGTGAIGIGYRAGENGSNYSVALGFEAGNNYDTAPLGQYAIAIGYRASYDQGVDNSIVLNASGNQLNATQAGLYINPVRWTETQDATDDGIMFYNQLTKEVRYSFALDGGSF